MYARTLTKASHVRKFSITPKESVGWEVREEADHGVVRHAYYEDWHRVERARRAFALEVKSLHDEGWTER